MTAGPDVALESAGTLVRQLDDAVENISSVLFGKKRVVRLALISLIAGGHLLIEDIPGVGKTTLAKAIARSLGLDCRRVQFTADLLPSEIVGALVLDPQRGAPVFRPGPVFTNLLLADELNRASAKAQSALLEAMEEGQVTVDGVTYPLPRPFLVIATQNPFDAAGTHPLPASQRDRFLIRTAVGYPGRQAEDHLLAADGARPRPEDLPVVASPALLDRLQAAIRDVHKSPSIRSYILDLVVATREHPQLTIGASPRASLALSRAASAIAVMAGRPYVTPDDVKVAASPVLGHRVVLASSAELSGVSSTSIVTELVGRLPVPLGEPVSSGYPRP